MAAQNCVKFENHRKQIKYIPNERSWFIGYENEIIFWINS